MKRFVHDNNASFVLEKSVVFIPVVFIFYAAILTQYIQEDALIYFRTASNLALHGDYSFNLGEKYPAATSTLYAFLIAALVRLFGDFFVLAVQVMNVGAAFLGEVLLANTLPRAEGDDGPFRPFVFWVVIVSPPFVTLATSGMETGLLFLALSALLFGQSTRKVPLHAAASLLMPFLRVEATVAPLIVAVFAALRGERRIMLWMISSTIVGLLGFLAANLFLAGEMLPQTIVAKNIAYQPPRSVSAILGRINFIFFERSFFLGVNMKYIPTALYYFIGIVVVTLSTALAVRYILVLRHGRHDVLDQLTPALLAIAFAFAFPLSYIYGGVISSWYLWPSSVLVYYLVARLIETW